MIFFHSRIDIVLQTFKTLENNGKILLDGENSWNLSQKNRWDTTLQYHTIQLVFHFFFQKILFIYFWCIPPFQTQLYTNVYVFPTTSFITKQNEKFMIKKITNIEIIWKSAYFFFIKVDHTTTTVKNYRTETEKKYKLKEVIPSKKTLHVTPIRFSLRNIRKGIKK